MSSQKKRSSTDVGELAPTTPAAKKRAMTDPQELIMSKTSELLNISPPRENGCIAKKNIVEARIHADGFSKYFLTDSKIRRASELAKQQAIILFSLYGRNYYPNSKAKRVDMVGKLLDENGEPFLRACDLFCLAGDTTGDSLGITDQLKDFVEMYGMGEGERGYNIFRGKGISMCRRVQQAGSCFVHAPIVMTAYKEGMDIQGEGATPQMIDMRRYVRHAFSDDELTELLVTNTGGFAVNQLTRLSGDAHQLIIHNLCKLFEQDKAEDGSDCLLLSELKQHGPALVSQFTLATDFGNGVAAVSEQSEPPYYQGELLNDSGRKHAMVLVGIRHHNQEWRVLLQNWWPNLPFVELSAEYLISSRAKLLFIPQTVEVPEYFERCSAIYAEANLEGSDMPPHEL